MKLGCATWLFSSPHYQPPYDEAVKIIGDMGFKGLELIAFEEKDLREYYAQGKIRELRKSYESFGMQLTEFAVYSPVIGGLPSLDRAERDKSFEVFKKAVQVGRDLGSRAMNLVSHWPYGMTCPISYPPSYITPFVNGVVRASPKLKMNLAHVDYGQVWDTYVQSLQRCLDICVENGMEFYIEGHANVIVSNTDTMLRLFDRIPSDKIGVNFDTAWHLLQREYLPLSIRKLGKRLRHFHLRDGDGMINYGLPCGTGIIDWQDFFETLKEIGFDGFLSFEITGFEDIKKYVTDSKEYIEKQMRLAGVK